MVNSRLGVVSRWRLQFFVQVPTIKYVLFQPLIIVPKFTVPIFFYMALFEVHFLTLETLGDGDEFVNSEFQCTLGGRGKAASLISGRHFRVSTTVSPSHVRNMQGSYLHSHPHDYPSGSQQQ